MIDIKYGKRKVVNYRGAKMVVGGLTAKNKIDILLYISRELAHINNEQELHSRVLSLCEEIFEVDNIHLRLWDPSIQMLKPVRYLAESDPPARDLKAGEGFSGRVFESRKAILEEDLEKKQDLLDQGEKTRCVACVPILYKETCLGTLSIEKHISYFYRTDDLEILEALAAQLGLALNEVQLVEGLVQAQNRIESDLRMGRNVQSHIIPRNITPWNGVDFYFYYEPMVEVSGDYFSVIRQGNTLTALIADVSGHGVPAALVTMALHHHFEQILDSARRLPEIVEELNRCVLPNLPEGTYFTAQIVRLHEDHSYSFVSAGHTRLLHFHYESDQFNELDSTGIPLGIASVSRDDYEEKSGRLEPGDFLVMMTDGFVEQKDPAGNQAGFKRVNSWLLEEKKRLIETEGVALAEKMGPSFLVRFEQYLETAEIGDDLCMIMLQTSPEMNQTRALFEKAKKAPSTEESLKLAGEVYDLNPSFLKNLLFMARTYYKQDDLINSVKYLQEYYDTSQDPSAQTVCMLGNLYFRLNNIPMAKKYYKKAVHVNPGFAEAAVMLAQCYLREKRKPRAVEILKIALQSAPGDEKIKTAIRKVEGASV